ncbi:hypothetical protein VTJ04DRAFT_9332 [Mycothermus thermophilus]|uniref:uncharacterized protein n=1 Tax=Humicola insolens TaxID=85995 RepID=UPI003742834D
MVLTLVILLGSLFGIAGAAPISNAEDWSDFTDNFATDLAPIIALFGEQVTKQYLSESNSGLDCIIFGMAPIGIITAIVSVIRLHGKQWLKVGYRSCARATRGCRGRIALIDE